MKGGAELVEASAGTGKTHALVERMVTALRCGAEPREVVALTFSRAAAGEIFTRFVGRLAAGGDAALLRKLVETQHLTLIGTLDSFLVRYVQMFPLELGITGEVKTLEGFGKASGRDAAAMSVLRNRDEDFKRAVTEAFRLASDGRAARSYLSAYTRFAECWHPLYLAHADRGAWGDAARIFGEAPPPELRATLDEIRAVAPSLARYKGKRGADRFIEAVASFNGELPKVPKAMEGDADAERAIRLMRGWRIGQALRTARGLCGLLEAFEAEYSRRVRGRGRLTFADFPRLIATLAPDARLALEYRMDAKIRHWALDEFQDTSREQWAAISNLVDEAVQGEGKSVFIVGDRKQAIYGWRNGDVGIFTGERESGRYALRELNESYRYCTEIAEAVNRVFCTRSMARFGKWHCPPHVAHDKAAHGFVNVVETGGGKMDDFIEPLANELLTTRPWERGLTCAVLVRGNAFGELLGAELRRAGVPAVWEGESALLDTPVLHAFTDLVRLAEHPGDEIAYNHLKSTPLGSALYPDGVPSAFAVSRDMLDSMTTRGLVRTFQDAKSRLATEDWDEFTEMRFADMLRAAAAFEAAMEPGTRLSTFIDYLEAERRRNNADAGSVRIMTIHRSKGLGFDYVLLPLYEYFGIDHALDAPIATERWVLPNPGEAVAQAYPEIDSTYEELKDASVYESLCVYYVAMTRAKKALSIFIPPPRKTSTTMRFSDFVRESAIAPSGDRAWYEHAAGQGARKAVDEGKGMDTRRQGRDAARKPRSAIRRRMPSKAFQSGISAGSLFWRDSSRRAAMQRGVVAHAAFEGVEWIDASEAKTPLERALVQPKGFVELWREKPYELFINGAWESGQFDRVVFTRDGDGGIRATIYDFKTNAKRSGESDDEFARRMGKAYSSQMAAYRRAVAILAGLPEERVEARLLLVSSNADEKCLG